MKKIIFHILILLLIPNVYAEEKCYVTFQYEEIKTVELECGTSVTSLQIPAKENQSFLGWYYLGEVYNFQTLVTSDIVLQAKWSEEDNNLQLDGANSEENTISSNNPIIDDEANENFYFSLSDVGKEVLLIGVVVVAALIQLVIIPKIKEAKIRKKIKDKK